LLGDLPVCSPESVAFDCLRIEAGLPRFGVDITEANLPQEVGRIDQTISYTKGCYIGQETVARVRSFGHVNRTLRGLVVAEKAALQPGVKLFNEGQEVGIITSSTISPRLDHAIALGYVRRGHGELGTRLNVSFDGKSVDAAVTSLPFVPFVTN
jgi:folate-binding protein YgfZ